MTSLLDTDSAPLTPTQARVRAELFGPVSHRPTFDPDLAQVLRGELEAGIGPVVADRQPDEPLVLTKRTISQLHSCEGQVEAERVAGFTWSVPVARGKVAHKAVEMSVTLREQPTPLDLVDLAIERLMESDQSLGTWLLDAPAGEVAEVRGSASDWLVKFQDSFPRLKREWRPRLESPLTVELCRSRVLLRGRVDLALGKAEGMQAQVLIVDFKSGRPAPVHADDLRFYALLETIRVGVPPYRLATFSLDSGTWVAEDVSEETLAAAVRRTIAAAAKMVELEAGRAPELRAGLFCRWCPASPVCETAKMAGDSPQEDR